MSPTLLTFVDKGSGATFSSSANGSLSFSTALPPSTYSVRVASIGTCTQLPDGAVLVVCTLGIP